MNKNYLEVQDIYFDAVNENKSYKSSHVRLLNGVSVKFESGKLIAVMGSNGAGKSTLVNLIIGRVEDGSKSAGKVIYNDSEEREAGKWSKSVAFLEQKEVYIKSLSVEVYLKYEIKFYRKDLGVDEQEKLLEDVMKKAAIIHKRHEVIGELSGGETKKVMIADVLLQDSEIFFMDEPTSWLDSWNAEEFIRNMKELAKEKNKMIIVIINQPGQGLFELFDDLVFLRPGGNLFYSGPVSDIDSFLESKSLIKPEGMPTVNYLFSLETYTRDSSIPVEGVTISNTSTATTYTGLNQIFTGAAFSISDVFSILRRRLEYAYSEGELNAFFLIKLLCCIGASYLFDMLISKGLKEVQTSSSSGGENLHTLSNLKSFRVFLLQVIHLNSTVPLFNVVSKFASLTFYNKHEITTNEIFLGKFSASAIFVSSLIFDTSFRLLASVCLYSVILVKQKEYFIDSFWLIFMILSSLMFSILILTVVSAIRSRYLYLLYISISYVMFFLQPEGKVLDYFVNKEDYETPYDRIKCYIWLSTYIFNPTNWLKLAWMQKYFGSDMIDKAIEELKNQGINAVKSDKKIDFFKDFIGYSCGNAGAFGIYFVLSLVFFITVYLLFLKMVSPTIRLKLQK